MNTRIKDITFQFSVDIIKFCYQLEQQGGIERTISWQLIRSGTSIGANVEEAQAGQSRADFIAKLSISRKEARESLYWIRLLTASGITPESELRELIKQAESILKILNSIIKTTRNNHQPPTTNHQPPTTNH